jgi:hypothetical protein
MEDHFHQPLKWWAANKLRLPRLYVMALDHLSIPPASTECERCFSLAKLIISTQRRSLKENTVSQIESYRSWKLAEAEDKLRLARGGGEEEGSDLVVLDG